jgi:hypothetical protein
MASSANTSRNGMPDTSFPVRGGILSTASVLILAIGLSRSEWGLVALGAVLLSVGLWFAQRYLPRRTLSRRLRWITADVAVLLLCLAISVAVGGALLLLTVAAAVFVAPLVADRLAPEDVSV